VPLLGDIPILGNLFKSRSRSRDKTNLMVFLRPVVMRSQEANNELTMDRYEFMRQGTTRPVGQFSEEIKEMTRPTLDPLKLSNRLTMPSVSQPLDEPGSPTPTVVMPADSGFAPKLAPQTSAPARQ
jgi:general secretion pathway protein D